jgi:DNA primase
MLNRPIIPGEYTIHTVFNRLKESEAAWQELEQAAISVSALQAALRQ